MSIGSFLKLVEIQTKVASMIPFLLGTMFTLYRYDSFKLENFIIMFVSLISFDMATTAINNYYDYKKATRTKDDSYRKANIIGKDNLKEGTVVGIIITLVLIAVVFGAILTVKTDVVVLLIGAVSFATGVLYTFGPIPLSRMPLGEMFSGFFMGFVILFLSIYIHIFDSNIVVIGFQNGIFNMSVNVLEVIYIFLISIPAVGGIANIMLANNTCDLEEDIINKRYTLPYYIGKNSALGLFKALYYIGYLAIIAMVILKIAPLAVLLVLLTIIPVNKHINMFYKKQVKSETFVLGVKNFLIMNGSLLLIMIIVNILSIFF
ncbi:1,4-dihydroxy-2-naphthoate polyprenyltransferase [Clostridium sp. UBA4548]|uniref:1,4-dihydroxy-2-naphthoate polyprenyltransferase n=1 Tax=Clostridium sp. UBA4548 TaxID=1946361 RepID=UPI0025C461EF|nr:1,4-dihydroxy-2-naphthoate polyprenyltransferase [Clostridium sp. UBA4548]